VGDKVRTTLARNLKAYRKMSNLSQMDLAEKAGLSTSFIAAIETERKFPSSKSILKIALSLGLEPYQLFITDKEGSIFLSYKNINELKEQLKKNINTIIEDLFIDR
jgi:transcriptional regulator with XRE-family HTH domain